jgi:hypothetical protein
MIARDRDCCEFATNNVFRKFWGLNEKRKNRSSSLMLASVVSSLPHGDCLSKGEDLPQKEGVV